MDFPRTAKLRVPDDWKERFIEKITATSDDTGICKICKHQPLILADYIVSPMIWKDHEVFPTGLHYPQAMLLCQSCGSTTYYNLVILGILDEAPK